MLGIAMNVHGGSGQAEGSLLGGKKGQNLVSTGRRTQAPSAASVDGTLCTVPSLGPVGAAPLPPSPPALPTALKSYVADTWPVEPAPDRGPPCNTGAAQDGLHSRGTAPAES